MAIFTTVSKSDPGPAAYSPNSSAEARTVLVSFAATPLSAVAGADTLRVIPVGAGESVIGLVTLIVVPTGVAMVTNLGLDTDAAYNNLGTAAPGAAVFTNALNLNAPAGTAFRAAGTGIGTVFMQSGNVILSTVTAAALTTGTVRITALIARMF